MAGCRCVPQTALGSYAARGVVPAHEQEDSAERGRLAEPTTMG